jgi:hypothetical protein
MTQVSFRKPTEAADVWELQQGLAKLRGNWTFRESAMKKLGVAGLALCATVAFTVISPPVRANGAEENCIVITGASDARRQDISRFRAQKRLARHIADYLRTAPAGATVGPTTMTCVLRGCEASALVCRP